MKWHTPLAFAGLLLLFSSGVCYPPAMPSNTDLAKLSIPDGFKVDVYAEDIDGARSLARANDHLIFVGSRSAGNVYALIDENKDYVSDKKVILAKKLNSPNGVVFHEGDLYVAQIDRIIVFRDIENNLAPDAPYEVIYSDLPDIAHHGWKYLAMSPENQLYFGVGAPCNICEREEEIFSTICRINPDGSGFDIFAHGVRNTIGFDWHPETGELWFTDNGRDMMGDNQPADELNHAPRIDMHFGYPYCHQGDILDPDFEGHSCADYVAPQQNLGPHVAALGMKFYTGEMFPDSMQHGIFIAEHGSWNRTTPIGYRLMYIPMKNGKPAGYQTFIEGWLSGSSAWGRPVDVNILGDGSLLLSDDHANMVYRIWYDD